MEVNFKVKINVTIEFPVEKYFRNCTDPLENISNSLKIEIN